MVNLNEPPRIAALEHDERGFPVPVIVLHDEEGKPYFTANDMLSVKRCVDNALCHICGQVLDTYVWFTGGPGSALLNGNVSVYADGPMHHECMQFAMRVCPHLSQQMTRAVSGIYGAKLEEKGIMVQDNTTMAGIPQTFIAVCTGHFTTTWIPGPHLPYPQFYVRKPWHKAEYWQKGEMMSLDKGRKAAGAAAREILKGVI